MTVPLLDVARVSKAFGRGGLLSRKSQMAVRDVSFALSAEKPEIFSIIGESGSGKSTLARMILGQHAPTSGHIRFRGRDVSTLRSNADRLAFMKSVQPIFQNPFEAFNPLKRLDRYLFTTAERIAGAKGEAAIHAAADEALQKVGLSLTEVRGRFPHELSGGQLQRVAIARALISKPAMIVADEPVSMVDASLRASIVSLFRNLRDAHGLTSIYITHDLATAYAISDRIVIMRKGEIVEQGDARTVLDDPQHPYSRLLEASVLAPLRPGETPAFPHPRNPHRHLAGETP
jgi:ABC-type glutathione transport system ATPase component